MFGTPSEDTYLELSDHLPHEAAEALLELATGGRPQPIVAGTAHIDPFQHPDAQRRFRVMSDIEELERALSFPWDRWTVFLHPAQRARWWSATLGALREYRDQPVIGKTIVALHRAASLARANPEGRVLLATFSEPFRKRVESEAPTSSSVTNRSSATG